MTEQEIKSIVTKQRNYFLTGATLPVSTRIDALHRLYAAITEHEKEINDALRKDLGKSGFESYRSGKIWVKADLRVICARQGWYWKNSVI